MLQSARSKHIKGSNCRFVALTKGITSEICRLCVCVIINKRSFDPFMCLDLVVLAGTLAVILVSDFLLPSATNLTPEEISGRA